MSVARRVLILYAHPAPQKSRVNRQLAAAVRDLPGVTFHDLYETYPDHVLDVGREQRLLLEHDVILLQHPLYWYSVPSLLKEWCDLVLEYGFAYGEGGTALAGKAWVHALTAGGPAAAYAPEGYNRFTIRQLLAPFDQTAHLCGMQFLAPFSIHSTLRLDASTEIPAAAAEYRRAVEFLRDSPARWTLAADWERRPLALDSPIAGGSAP